MQRLSCFGYAQIQVFTHIIKFKYVTPTGRHSLLLQRFDTRLADIMILTIVCISWRCQRSSGDEVLYASGTFGRVLLASVASTVTLEVPRDS